MKVLVTGADGFIGSHLVQLLLEQGHSVRALSLYNSFNHWGWLEDVPADPRLEIVSGDVRDISICRRITEGVDRVYHLAALIAIPYSYSAPDSYIDTNVKGTANICRSALDNGCKKVLVTSTSEVYGTARYVPINESHPLQPQSPYSASKIGADSIAMSFHLSFGLPLVIARPFNTYGPRQSARAVIPSIITQLASGKTRIKLGDVAPTRDLTYVTDTCRALILLAECEEASGKTVNIGSGFEVSIGDLFTEICSLMNVKAEAEKEEIRIRPASSEVFRLWCDNSLIRELTGFKPGLSLKEGLLKTIEWFRDPSNLSRYKANLYNV